MDEMAAKLLADLQEEKESKRRAIRVIIALGIYLITGLAIIWFFNNIGMLNYIPSASMEGTLDVGDVVLANRTFTEIHRYDIVVFTPPAGNEDMQGELYIKRVIGLPGETIVVDHGEVYADGVKLDESFTKEEMEPWFDGVFKVPEGCYFMMGDNRNNSYDSRLWEDSYVPCGNIVSVATETIFPLHRIRSLKYVPAAG